MINHLESFTLKLKLLSPVFIGSGMEINKKEYLFYSNKAYILDFSKLVAFLDNKGFINDYTNFMLSPKNDLNLWFTSMGINKEEYTAFTKYELSAEDALDDRHSLKGIQLFIKDTYGLPYIPGSSLKGALRTAILSKMLNDDKAYSASHMMGLEMGAKTIENDKLHTLSFATRGPVVDKSNATNSAMRGLQISDSLPLCSEDLILCTKIDVKKNGFTKSINTCREALKPGTMVEFNITLDIKVLETAKINKTFILEAVKNFAEIQNMQYSLFTTPPNVDAAKCVSGNELYLGGGVGFISKTFVYAMNEQEGLKFTANLLNRKFIKHQHMKDIAEGVSPHTIKYTSYKNKLYRFGRCEVIFE